MRSLLIPFTTPDGKVEYIDPFAVVRVGVHTPTSAYLYGDAIGMVAVRGTLEDVTKAVNTARIEAHTGYVAAAERLFDLIMHPRYVIPAAPMPSGPWPDEPLMMPDALRTDAQASAALTAAADADGAGSAPEEFVSDLAPELVDDTKPRRTRKGGKS